MSVIALEPVKLMPLPRIVVDDMLQLRLFDIVIEAAVSIKHASSVRLAPNEAAVILIVVLPLIVLLFRVRLDVEPVVVCIRLLASITDLFIETEPVPLLFMVVLVPMLEPCMLRDVLFVVALTEAFAVISLPTNVTEPIEAVKDALSLMLVRIATTLPTPLDNVINPLSNIRPLAVNEPVLTFDASKVE